MNRLSLVRSAFAVAGTTSLLLVGAGAGPAQAAPPAGGCPPGMELLSVAELLETGYRIPARIDDPNSGIKTFGRPGNGDGYICGKPLGNQMVNGLQLYMFFDNQLPASR